MATQTGYLIVRSDYSTFDSSVDVNSAASPDPAAGKDATPGNSIDDIFTFTVTLPDGSTEPGTEDYPFEVWADLVEACNAVVQHYYNAADVAGAAHPRLLEVSYDDVTDVTGDAFPGLSGYTVKRLDVVSEIDEATIRATATV
jgi:hypothetical protein